MARLGSTIMPSSGEKTTHLPWLRSPLWDLALLGFCWIPFYAWVVWGLGLDGSWAGVTPDGTGNRAALALASAVALGITYVHRHYTFILVYGDGGTFRQRARDFIVAPAVVVATLVAVRGVWGAGFVRPEVFGFELKFRPWMVILTLTGLWNVWHTLMQRYGISRIYAGKFGDGLRDRSHGRRELALMWALVAWIACVALMFRASTFAGVRNARRVYRTFEPVIQGALGWTTLAVVTGVVAWLAVRWARHEFSGSRPPRDRIPRLCFLASTLCLLLVFILHGPIVGYLCFGVAHALEYVAFVHHFGQKKFAHASNTSPVARLLRRPLLFAPAAIGLLVTAYLLLRDYRRTDVFVVYYTGTSLLHFLYDGWIWKVRKPEVARPLGVGG